MNDIVIDVQGLGKRYRLRHREGLGALGNIGRRLFGNDKLVRPEAQAEDFWALKDISFQVKRGEILGIIGHNGAGKSTLLKLLGRITNPTAGRAEVRGQVGMLLEVGTGFHPDLTGRENVFLGGAILGMSHAETQEKYDGIVDFAGIDDFMDMPVKHYSSGMNMRLALSVAMHLNAEIVFLDEIWAVGDLAFQQKSLKRIEEMIASGLTFIIVSHNTATMRRLCNRCILLDHGRMIMDDKPEKVIAQYEGEVLRRGTVSVPHNGQPITPSIAVTTQISCRACGTIQDDTELILGVLPPCNRYTGQPCSDGSVLAMGICPECGLIQLTRFPAYDKIVRTIPWLRYNEPEAHLDLVCARLEELLQPTPRVITVGPFDAPLLDRLGRMGAKGKAIDLLADLPTSPGIYPYLETMQERLRPNLVQAALGNDGKADLVVCRYLLEHCRDPIDALDALALAAKPDGLVLIEVPDSSKFLARKDYSFVWEEHHCYFTEASLRALLSRSGLEAVEILRFPGELEDALVALCRPRTAPEVETADSAQLFDDYREAFAAIKAGWHALLPHAAKGGKVAVFGAGHQTIMAINALSLADFISYVVDDDPAKRGLYPPGMAITIIGSEQMLADPEVTLCLLGVSPRIHDRIKAKCAALTERGGRFLSLFPTGQGESLLEMVPDGLTPRSQEVLQAASPVSSVSADQLVYLRSAVFNTPRRRVRINLHGDSTDSLHEMIIALRRGSYIRPHRHIGKSESFHIIEGSVDVVIFDNGGEISEVVRLSDNSGDGACFYRLSAPLYHTLVIRSEVLVMHETTNGPFVAGAAEFAPFSPEEGDAAVAAYGENLTELVDSHLERRP